MIPIKDNLRYNGFAWVSVAIFAANVFVYIYETMLGVSGSMQSVLDPWTNVHDTFVNGLASGNLPEMLHSVGTLFSCMFMHQNFMHIFGNMCFFFTFAPALEARMGHGRFLLFYLASGVAACFAFMFTDPTGTGHAMGASGAIGGVLGAYLVYFPRARVHGWTPLMTPLTTVAAFFLADFFLVQWFSIWQQSHMPPGQAAGVAYWAHIGGIAFGMLVAALMALSDAGRLKKKDVRYFVVVSELVIVAFLAKLGLAKSSLPFNLGCAAVVAIALYAVHFKHGSEPWYKTLGTPLTTMLIALMVGISLEQLFEMFVMHAANWYTVHVGVICSLAMIGSIIIAAAARKLPVAKVPVVVCPRPKEGERILGEVVADLVVGFCRLVSNVVTAPFVMLAAAVPTVSRSLSSLSRRLASSKGSTT